MLEKDTTLIIPAYCDHPSLAQCLASVHRLDPPPGEVIIVIDGHDHPTIERSRQAGFQTIVLEEAPGVAAARNAGARAAKGELLLFTDSDIELPPSFVSQAVSIFQRVPEYAAAIGSYDDQPGARSIVSRYRNLLHHFTHQHGQPEAQTFWGGCGAVRKEAFLKTGGFDIRYRKPSVEDIELGYRMRRMGLRIGLDPAWQVRHLKAWTLATMMRTDLFCRAIPWSRLLLREKRMDNDLNIDTGSRISGLLLVLILAGLGGSLLVPRLALVAIAGFTGIILINHRFFGLLWRKGGLVLAACGTFLHLAYLGCGVLGFATARLTHQDRIISRRTQPHE